MTQISKRPRSSVDISQLSVKDQLTFQRVAQLLNKPLSELYEESADHTHPPPRTVVEDAYPAGESMYSSSSPWSIPPMQEQTTDYWPQEDGSGAFEPQSNGSWTKAPSAMVDGESSTGVASNQWTHEVSQIPPPLFVGTEDRKPFITLDGVRSHRSPSWSHEPTSNEPWVSVPTNFLTHATFQEEDIEDFIPRKNSHDTEGERTTKDAYIASPNFPSTTNADGPEQDRSLAPRASSRPTDSSPDDSLDRDFVQVNWEDIKTSQIIHSSPDGASVGPPITNWSMTELANPHETFVLDNSNPNNATWASVGLGGKVQRRRGRFQDQQLREETSNTRKLKACMRCRMQKIRCQINPNDPSGDCQTCQAVTKQKVHTLPCVRYKLTECTLYRTGKAPGLEFTFRWPVMMLKDISEWSDTRIRTIQVVSDICPIPLELSVCKFVPIPQDSLHKSWMDGKTKKFKLTTPYAIVNMSAAVKDMRDYINRHIFECMEYWLRGRDAWIQETYIFARKYMLVAPPEEAALLGDFFRLWFAVRRTATTEFIAGEDTLDMTPETNDRSYPLFGKVPLPPVMIQQLDMILTLGFLQPLLKKVLEDFQKIVLNNKPKSWMTIYLITFMSLHSAATLTEENYRNARKHGLKRRFAMPNFISERHHSANVFLAHYHYCTEPCNPFTLDWRRRQTTDFAEMTTNEIDFLLRTSDMVEERRDRFRRVRDHDLYEDDFYFVSQMFEKDWVPRDTIIDFGDETITGVRLKQFGSPK